MIDAILNGFLPTNVAFLFAWFISVKLFTLYTWGKITVDVKYHTGIFLLLFDLLYSVDPFKSQKFKFVKWSNLISPIKESTLHL